MSEVHTVINYSRVRIGSSEVILPLSAEMSIVSFDGRKSRNVLEFSGCREYGSESKITFGSPEAIPPRQIDVTLTPGPKDAPSKKK